MLGTEGRRGEQEYKICLHAAGSWGREWGDWRRGALPLRDERMRDSSVRYSHALSPQYVLRAITQASAGEPPMSTEGVVDVSQRR